MQDSCQNCNRPILENFCSNCGQKKYKRIDRKYLIDELQYSVIHTNKGFFYSVKNIILNPGKTARNFIDGNRVNHYKPILLAFVLSGISAFLSFKVLNFNEKMHYIYAENNIPESLMRDLMAILSSYSSLMMLLFIPIISIITVLVFRKWGQNYYEHIVMNAYIQSCYSIFTIILVYPLLYFFRHDIKAFTSISMYSMFAISIIMIWFYKGFYREKTFNAILLRMLLFLALGFILYIMLVIAMVILIFVLNPDIITEIQKSKAGV